jgi:signal transduction histidine kinase
MLHLNDVSLRVGGHLLLEGATVHVPAGHRVGLVGRNGSGKTSLLRLIQGETQPDAGTLRLRKGARIGWVAQEAPGGQATPREVVLAADRERERLLAAAEERARIARDLHDSAGHAINVILVHAGLGRLRTESDPESARQAFETIEDVARETVGEIDEMVRILREDASLPGEVEPPPGLAALEGLVERHGAAGLRVTSTIRGDRRPLPAGIDRGAYRILQEALTNAARHGDGTAEVEVGFGESFLEFSVANPLRGDPADRAAGGGGHGITGMRERAALLGGSLEAEVRDGRFELRARLPFADSRA